MNLSNILEKVLSHVAEQVALNGGRTTNPQKQQAIRQTQQEKDEAAQEKRLKERTPVKYNPVYDVSSSIYGDNSGFGWDGYPIVTGKQIGRAHV